MGPMLAEMPKMKMSKKIRSMDIRKADDSGFVVSCYSDGAGSKTYTPGSMDELCELVRKKFGSASSLTKKTEEYHG